MFREFFRSLSQKDVQGSLEQQYRQAVVRVLLDLDEKGLLGKHELKVAPTLQRTSESGLIGMVNGSIFGFQGNLYGEQTSEPALVFTWVTNSEHPLMVVSSVPSSKLFIKQADQPQPTVEFQFNLPHFVRLSNYLFLSYKYAMETIQYQHPNDYIKPEAVHAVVIEANPEAFNQLQSLQFGQSFLLAPKSE